MKNSIGALVERPLGAVIVIILLGFIVHCAMLSAPFKTLDDQVSIVNNTQIQNLANVKDLFLTSFFGGEAYYRPLVALSFMLEYRAYGLNPFAYNLHNLLLHLLTAVVVFLLMCRILGDHRLAYWTGLLFAVHPIHWEAVGNIPGRAILLSALFGLTSFLCYLKAAEQTAARRWGWMLLALMSFGCALLSKESAAMLPAVLTAYFFFRSPGFKNRGPRLWTVFPFFLLLIIYLAWRRNLGMTGFFQYRNVQEQILGMLSFGRGVFTYLRLLILPVDLHFDRSREFWMSFSQPVLWGTVGWYTAALAGVVICRRKISARTGFLGVWAALTLFPVSQTMASIGVQPGYISLAEHFFYMPAVALLALVVMGLRQLRRYCLNENAELKLIVRVGMAMYLIFILGATVKLSVHAQSEEKMYDRTLFYAPHNARIRDSRALVYAAQGDYVRAADEFRLALQHDPTSVRARIGLGKALCDLDRCYEGLLEYEQVFDPGAYQELLEGNLLAARAIVMDQYLARLKEEPKNAALLYSIGVHVNKVGHLADAENYYRRALAIDPNLKEAQFNLATLDLAKGSVQKALTRYKALADLEGPKTATDYEACLRVADILIEQGALEDAGVWQARAASIAQVLDPSGQMRLVGSGVGGDVDD